MSNSVAQWQIVTKDPDKLANFYGKLFGWKITTNNSLGYREVDGGGIRGGIWPSPAEGHNFVQLFISVDDLERSVKNAAGLGAKVIVPPTALPDGDSIAILHDPAGIPFAMMKSR